MPGSRKAVIARATISPIVQIAQRTPIRGLVFGIAVTNVRPETPKISGYVTIHSIGQYWNEKHENRNMR
jgi:hypothetical protein